jgi:hypothetical protein
MFIYCQECNENHWFTAGDVERILYALQASHADALCEDAKAEDPWKEMVCFCSVLAWAGDIEAYSEMVGSCVDRRRELAKEAIKGGAV